MTVSASFATVSGGAKKKTQNCDKTPYCYCIPRKKYREFFPDDRFVLRHPGGARGPLDLVVLILVLTQYTGGFGSWWWPFVVGVVVGGGYGYDIVCKDCRHHFWGCYDARDINY